MARDDEYDGIPSDEHEGDTYMEMLADMDRLDDGFAADLLWAGWFDPDVSAEQRMESREMFFDYMDWDPADFDWEAWAEWYGEAA